MSIESLHSILRIAPGCDFSDRCPRGISEHFLNISPAVSVGAQWLFSCEERKYGGVTADKTASQNIYFASAFVILAADSSLRFKTQKFVNRSGLEKLCSCTGGKREDAYVTKVSDEFGCQQGEHNKQHPG